MSHIVRIETQVRDPVAVLAACRRLGLAEPTQGTAQLFSAQASGLLVQLPGWRYPLVCDLAAGALSFDNYAGAWGEPRHLDRFLQIYACEKAKLEARKHGHQIVERALDDGSIRLAITVAAGGVK